MEFELHPDIRCIVRAALFQSPARDTPDQPAPSPPRQIVPDNGSSQPFRELLHRVLRQSILLRLLPKIASNPRSSGSTPPDPSAALLPGCPPSSSPAFPFEDFLHRLGSGSV